MNVDDPRQRMLRVRTALDRDAEDGLRLFHRDVEVPSVVRYNVGRLVLALLQRGAVLVHRQPLHRLGRKSILNS